MNTYFCGRYVFLVSCLTLNTIRINAIIMWHQKRFERPHYINRRAVTYSQSSTKFPLIFSIFPKAIPFDRFHQIIRSLNANILSVQEHYDQRWHVDWFHYNTKNMADNFTEFIRISFRILSLFCKFPMNFAKFSEVDLTWTAYEIDILWFDFSVILTSSFWK